MNDAQRRILELLEEPGSRTKASLVDELESEFERVEVVRELGNLLVEGTIEEHPEIDGAYSIADSD